MVNDKQDKDSSSHLIYRYNIKLYNNIGGSVILDASFLFLTSICFFHTVRKLPVLQYGTYISKTFQAEQYLKI